ncbi:MAG: response regulator [Gammaproteobacteria bacterium]|nr:response regulator [Gammaproteobacteria bacterium]
MEIKRFGFNRLFRREVQAESAAPAVVEQPPAEPDRLRPNPGTQVLIVDDSKTVHVMLSRILRKYGYETLSAYDGETGLELIATHRPALVLMDVVMPGMSGFQATRQIRKSSDPEIARLPVLIISGNAQPTEEYWSAKIGANGFLAKPFDNNELLDRIEALLYPHAQSVAQ